MDEDIIEILLETLTDNKSEVLYLNDGVKINPSDSAILPCPIIGPKDKEDLSGG